MADLMEIEPPKLKFVFGIDFTIENPPTIISNGPKGTRVMYAVAQGGTFEGGEGHEDFRGSIIAPSADFTRTMHADSSGITLDVHFQFRLHDGSGVVLGRVDGRALRDISDATKSSIHSGISFETGLEKYRWMNNRVFVGKGRKDGFRVKVDYYEII